MAKREQLQTAVLDAKNKLAAARIDHEMALARLVETECAVAVAEERVAALDREAAS